MNCHFLFCFTDSSRFIAVSSCNPECETVSVALDVLTFLLLQMFSECMLALRLPVQHSHCRSFVLPRLVVLVLRHGARPCPLGLSGPTFALSGRPQTEPLQSQPEPLQGPRPLQGNS